MTATTRMPALLLAVLTGCTPRSGTPSEGAPPALAAVPVDTLEIPVPVVRIRDYSSAPTVTVLAWSADESAYGLRSQLRRRGGSLVGASDGEHLLFMSVQFVEHMGGFTHAWMEPDHLLVRSGNRRDSDACRGGDPCSPMVFAGVRIPDRRLRASQDGLTVAFHGGRTWSVTIPAAVVDVYVSAVDSLAAAYRRGS